MAHKLVYSDEARADLYGIYDWIAFKADPHTAFVYTGRIDIIYRRRDLSRVLGQE